MAVVDEVYRIVQVLYDAKDAGTLYENVAQLMIACEELTDESREDGAALLNAVGKVEAAFRAAYHNILDLHAYPEDKYLLDMFEPLLDYVLYHLGKQICFCAKLDLPDFLRAAGSTLACGLRGRVLKKEDKWLVPIVRQLSEIRTYKLPNADYVFHIRAAVRVAEMLANLGMAKWQFEEGERGLEEARQCLSQLVDFFDPSQSGDIPVKLTTLEEAKHPLSFWSIVDFLRDTPKGEPLELLACIDMLFYVYEITGADKQEKKAAISLPDISRFFPVYSFSQNEEFSIDPLRALIDSEVYKSPAISEHFR